MLLEKVILSKTVMKMLQMLSSSKLEYSNSWRYRRIRYFRCIKNSRGSFPAPSPSSIIWYSCVQPEYSSAPQINKRPLKKAQLYQTHGIAPTGPDGAGNHGRLRDWLPELISNTKHHTFCIETLFFSSSHLHFWRNWIQPTSRTCDESELDLWEFKLLPLRKEWSVSRYFMFKVRVSSGTKSNLNQLTEVLFSSEVL